MRKALILTGFNPYSTTGGVETFTQELISLLNTSGLNPDLACASDFENAHNLKNKFIGQVYAAGKSLLSADAGVYEFVLSNGYYGGGYFPKKLKTFTVFHSTHAGYAEAIKSQIPASSYLEIRYLVGELLERSSAAGSKVIAVSTQVKAELHKYYGLREVDVVSNPVDTDFFTRLTDRENIRAKYMIPTQKKVGLFVGRWEFAKGIDILQRVQGDLEDLFWVVVTSSGVEAPHPGGNSIVLSGLSKVQMREIYSLADFMLFPSRYEGFGLAAAEAMASGLPVIGTPVGFLGDIYSEQPFSTIAIHAPLEDSDTVSTRIKDSIHRLISDELSYKEISLQGRDIIVKNHRITLWNEQMKSMLCLN
jgi:glycosyltransferase involved in cell wall biosynthesis